MPLVLSTPDDAAAPTWWIGLEETCRCCKTQFKTLPDDAVYVYQKIVEENEIGVLVILCPVCKLSQNFEHRLPIEAPAPDA